MATVQESHQSIRRSPDAGPARAAIEEGRRCLQAGDADGAAAGLKQFATRADAPPQELADAAKVMADAGSPAEAVARYLEAGRGWLDAGDAAQARHNFAAAYEIDGKNMDALFELGRADVSEDKKHDALDKFVEVLRKSNLKHLPALYEAGCLYELDGQHNQAILAFKRVVERDKAHVSAFEHLGNLHRVRKQLPDAVANYVKAAEAAQTRYLYADAKRLAEAALSIDSGNANARRVLDEAQKAAASGSKPEPAQAPARAAAQPAADAHPATTFSDVTPVAPPTADGPVPPPPTAPSTLDMNLPSDVALLEQQSQAMAQLAKVQSAVAQTYRQRMALEEEIKRAQAALEDLQRQQNTIEEDLSGKRDDLAKAVADREAEEAALSALGDAIAKSKSELEALSTLPALIGDVRAKCAAAADLVTKTAAEVGAVVEQSGDARAKAGTADAGVKELQAKLAAAKQAAEEHERRLADVAASIQSAFDAASAADKQADSTKAALQALAAKHQTVEASGGALAGLATQVDAKIGEANAALQRLAALQAQRKSQFDEIVFTLTPLVGTIEEPAGAAPQREAAPKQSAAPAPAPAPSGPATADSLIASGKFADALQRALTEANAQPKPADYLVDVGSKVRAAGKLDDAVKLFAAARDRDQSSARARYELGSTYVDLDRVDEALALLHSVETDPGFAVLAQVAIGKCLRKQGNLEAAEACFSKALEVEGRPDGDYHQALYQLADLHESKGDPESLGLALWSWEELQTGNPNYGDVAQRIENVKALIARSEHGRNGALK